MSRRTQLVLTVIGALIFAVLVERIGPRTIVAYALQTGWMAIPIVLVYLPVYLCNAFAWHLVLSTAPAHPPFHKTFAITVSGFAINYVTPIVSLGGEPFKIAAVAPWTGRRRATSSVILFGMLHALSHLFIWLTAVIIALVILPRSTAGTLALAFAGSVLLLMIAFVFWRHHRGVLEDLLAMLLRVPLLGRLLHRWSHRRELLALVDQQITEFWALHRRRFFLALASEYLGRAISVIEFWLILSSVGYAVGYLQAFLVGSFASLVINLLFFVPFSIGSKEGGVVAVFAALGLPAGIGFFASLVTRLREMVWIAVGLAMIWLTGAGARGGPRVQEPIASRDPASPPDRPAREAGPRTDR